MAVTTHCMHPSRAASDRTVGHFPAGPRKKLIRKLLLLPALLVLALGARAQHNLVLYHMRQVPQAALMNPAQLPLAKAYVGLPGL